VWGNQFILGHELGHALIHQLNIPLTGMEEDSADGFATFFTVNDKDTGPNAALGAAVLIDAMGSKRPNLTLEDFSSDRSRHHAAGLQFHLCRCRERPATFAELTRYGRLHPPDPRPALSEGMDSAELRLVDPARPHLTDSSKKETKAARQQARKDLEDENKVLPDKIRQVLGGQ
jgi:hypothetical protein